jgi:putative spermidine/putrescine transport system permease protein
VKLVARAYLALLLLFLLGPAAVVAFDSINSATSFPSPFERATLRWYAALAGHPEFLDALLVSALIAVAAAGIATVGGFLAVLALRRMPPALREGVATALVGPLLVPEIVVGLAVLQVARLAAVPLGLGLLIGTHAVFVLPVALRLVLAGVARLDPGLEEAARSMGAGPVRAAWLITVPLLRPSLLASFVLSMVLSFVNLPLSMFLTTAQTATLPVIVFAYMESRIDPMVAAVATLVMLFATAAALAVNRLAKVRLA